MTRGGALLAIDTATSEIVVAVGHPDGRPIAVRRFAAERQHGERLLGAIAGLLADAGLVPADLGGIVVGTGPGAFTGLRVGLATAKTLAHELGLPIAGVSTGAALIASAANANRTGAAGTADDETVLVVPAGPQDRIEIRGSGEARLLPGGREPESGGRLMAIDLEGRAPEPALALGRRALDGLAAALLAIGANQLRERSEGDDLERLVPEYVTLPRGVGDQLDVEGGVSWSRDRR
jgi:hypothetical protein